MEILIYHPVQIGDVVIGSHCARLLKKKHPESTITFVTSEFLVPLIEPCPWIDFCVPAPEFQSHELVNPRDSHKYRGLPPWEINDIAHIKTFEKLREDWKPDKAYRPHWSPSPPHPVSYRSPYMFRCYASCCELTEEESNDTAYRLPIDLSLIHI